jgi:hypothetical protein
MTEELPLEIEGKRWIHSREEDANDVQVYRPSDFNFPLSRRPRTAFEISKNGIIIEYGIAPDDTRKPLEGNWTIEGPNTIRIDFIDKSMKSYKMKIISCTSDTLRIKKFG